MIYTSLLVLRCFVLQVKNAGTSSVSPTKPIVRVVTQSRFGIIGKVCNHSVQYGNRTVFAVPRLCLQNITLYQYISGNEQTLHRSITAIPSYIYVSKIQTHAWYDEKSLQET